MNPVPTDIYGFIQAGGMLALLLLFVAGFWKGWWVTGREMKKESERADKFEGFYDQAATMLKSSLDKSEDANRNLRDQVDLLAKLVQQATGKQP